MTSITVDHHHNVLLLSFPYDKWIIEVIKKIPERAWDPIKKQWKIPALLDNYELLKQNLNVEFVLTAKALNWIEEVQSIQRQIKHAQKFKTLVDFPIDYTFKTKPFNHQLQCFNFFKNLHIGGLFLEMGLGKTKIVIDVVSYHFAFGNIKKILYVCPNSIIENVKDEFGLHSHIKFDICMLVGPKPKRLEMLKGNHDVYILNYESVKTLEKELEAAKFDCIICDESTRIKNPQALCSKTLHKLGKEAKYRYILTGTPITQSAIDIFSQYKFLEPNIFGPSFYAFRNKYAIMGGYLDKQIIGYRQLDDLEHKLFQTAIRFTKHDCLDLPDKIYEVKQFDLSPEEQELYDKIKEEIFVTVENQQISVPLIITKLLKLNQICSGFVKLDTGENYHLPVSSKLKLLKETIEDILPHKTIVWCNFIDNIKNVSKILNDMGIKHVCFYGETPQADRQSLIQQFQTDPECKVFIGQIQTGGLGINLTAASYVIYFSNTYSLANRLQSEDRAHRIGQTNKVTYIDLVARKTIEKSILKILKKKLDLATQVIDMPQIKQIANGEYE